MNTPYETALREILHDFGRTYNILIKDERVTDMNRTIQAITSLNRESNRGDSEVTQRDEQPSHNQVVTPDAESGNLDDTLGKIFFSNMNGEDLDQPEMLEKYKPQVKQLFMDIIESTEENFGIGKPLCDPAELRKAINEL